MLTKALLSNLWRVYSMLQTVLAWTIRVSTKPRFLAVAFGSQRQVGFGHSFARLGGQKQLTLPLEKVLLLVVEQVAFVAENAADQILGQLVKHREVSVVRAVPEQSAAR